MESDGRAEIQFEWLVKLNLDSFCANLRDSRLQSKGRTNNQLKGTTSLWLPVSAKLGWLEQWRRKSRKNTPKSADRWADPVASDKTPPDWPIQLASHG